MLCQHRCRSVLLTSPLYNNTRLYLPSCTRGTLFNTLIIILLLQMKLMNFLPMFNAHVNYIFITILLLQFFLWTKTTSTVDIEHSLAQLEMDATSLSWQRTTTVKELRPAVVFTPLRPRISDFNFCKDEHKYAYVTSALYSTENTFYFGLRGPIIVSSW